MIKVTLSQIANITRGELFGDDLLIDEVSTDTRAIDNGALFVALVGERFDAHNFCQQAVDAGAGALLVQKRLDVNVPQVVVSDTKMALGELASWVHQTCQTPTVAITGSCGKTTVKEMVASILQLKGKVLFTAGNFNNDIGVPLTLLRSQQDDDYAVIELGANHIGEIAYTTQLVKPDIALVNNVAAAHLEGFGSIDGVKQAKGEIYQGLAAGSIAIVNLDSNGETKWESVLADKEVITFSQSNSAADYYASNIVMNAAGEASFNLHIAASSQEIELSLGIIGQHNVANAIAASIIALQMGATLEEVRAGLKHLNKVKGRVEVEALSEKIKLIDDSYNASVPAMKAAVDLLAAFPGQRWLILGNMAELGEESLALHRQVGEHAAPQKFEHVLTYGADAKVISELCQGIHFETHQEMIEYIKQHLDQAVPENHTILVKGANGARMFEVAAALKEYY
ncbi:UDP-N-acetylmuramoyl-tripeptide--D-alanyl-D-alanine ligase [Vibrio diabolicus]|uniref:UDP-N-acetylmuramoyl-tripeptide--D-alanyl-D- alanine ligase n=1 Tax=Vibrio diabolicus TaxID=50719 RepID=UPI00215FBD43|nr:UDP-N-acetylmuramoyl-tripeptide--D-alanyl-D-alanine ligase [Vibrio diabolicus]MCR9565690.1 UDP-N-acetylmuramoyl-tripeptide--D-alanyl-D-alanine ligase [Vibrio alginolyticus]MCS0028490.1 UDP-N-acetylmuramoyl-tripeptide--D-alanyl-D-alanine ligase [Vibrio alginolyticus]MCS0337624.1 UDP-N-acetylmuramoyl-tripeptide--D-alanyl-D-alanine ligase [Vibrio diabolicus]MEA3483586.1 UDP-N-acetylmuramoyl-tripeptide--D-alanyl-D-alanine ligase [Pseudomonadota bacterium]